jgi:putative membrane-bound dehydrogenase-like protein
VTRGIPTFEVDCMGIVGSLLFWAPLLAAALAGEPVELRVPPGFTVDEFADSTLANDIYRMTLDPRGRVVVAGRGYIRILDDENGDGRADRAIEFADGPRDGAMGLLWEGDALLVTGDGGLRRYRDRDGDGRADGPSELIRAMNTGGEHNAHAIRRGPDGWLYVICGNFTGIDASFAQLETSPIRDPVAGCVLRFTPDLKASEVVADGFRNAYGMDFNPDGELFAFDSDNERCVSLPWYEPTRFYHVVSGAHHGWRAPQRGEFWRAPPYDPDVARPLVTLGRGSPTGVACYRHTQFPARYRGGFFLLDWTFGKVHFVALEHSGATFAARSEVFAESVGTGGFAPTDVAVHPGTGDLYVSVGGRGTRGAVYRVRYVGRDDPAPASGLGPASLTIRPRSLAAQPNLERKLLEQATAGDDPARLGALIAIRRHRDRLATAIVLTAIEANMGHADHTIRWAVADLIGGLDADTRKLLEPRARRPEEQVTLALGSTTCDPATALSTALRLIANADVGLGPRLRAVRALQLALGDLTAAPLRGTVWEGYSPRRELPPSTSTLAVLAALRAAFPSGHAELDRELARTLAVLEDDDPATLEKAAGFLSETSHPVDDLHYLIVLGRLRAARPSAVTARVAHALLALDGKFTERRASRDRYWPLRVTELLVELTRKDPALNTAILADPDFGRPDHALFALTPGFDRRRAAEVFLDRAHKVEEYPWNENLVELVGGLPPERSQPVLRALWSRAGLDDAIIEVLARHPDATDRGKFLDGLASTRWSIARLSLDALEALPRVAAPGQDAELLVALVAALGRVPEGKEGTAMRERIARGLQRATGKTEPGADRAAWATWLAEAHPELAARLATDGVDLARWHDRLARLDWSAGAADRGRDIFIKTGCGTCHSGGQALGPDLHGVTGRFSRDDLFRAILQPGRDVPARYRTTLVATTEGQVYQGMIVYEAVDGVILQTGATTTVRLAGDQIASRRDAPGSFMPTGILERLADREIADLYAYLRSLGAPRPDNGRR